MGSCKIKCCLIFIPPSWWRTRQTFFRPVSPGEGQIPIVQSSTESDQDASSSHSNQAKPQPRQQPQEKVAYKADTIEVCTSFDTPSSQSSHVNEIKDIIGGRLRAHYQEWCKITSDPVILNAVRGYEIEFTTLPIQETPPIPYKRNVDDFHNINDEIKNLWKKGVIEPCSHEEGEYISNIFSRPKKNGGTRIILDLSELNKCLDYQHFKMDNIHTATYLITPNCYLASVDLRDAYYSVPVHPEHRKYLKFIWNQKMWQFKVLPNGLSTAPRLFTKLLKPVFSQLRREGHTVVGYLDDTIIIGKDEENTEKATRATTDLLTKLGFIVHPEKSVLNPTRKLQFLGFELDTENMVLRLPHNKMQDILQACTDLLSNNEPSIRRVAMVIGKLIATFPAAQYGPLHYRALERDKIRALKCNKGHFDRKMALSPGAKNELKWWVANIQTTFAPIVRGNPSLELQTDASGAGWRGQLTSKLHWR